MATLIRFALVLSRAGAARPLLSCSLRAPRASLSLISSSRYTPVSQQAAAYATTRATATKRRTSTSGSAKKKTTATTKRKPAARKAKSKKIQAKPKRKRVVKKKVEKEPKKTTLKYPAGPVNGYSLYCQEQTKSLKGSITDLESAQAVLKQSASAWKSLSASEKLRYQSLAEAQNAKRETEWASWKASLTPEEISRERKVQAYRRKTGLRIPPASRYATKQIRKGPVKVSPYIKFIQALYADPTLAQQVAGAGWGSATTVEKGKLAGRAWKGLSASEKSSYA